MEDREIVQLFWKRSEAAIKETEIKYGAKLHRLAMKILNSRLDAEESVNDTFLETWNTIPPKKPDYFFAYIAKICRYLSFGKLDWKNAKKRSAELVSLTSEMELCIPDPSSEIDEDRTGEEIGQLIIPFRSVRGKATDIHAALLVYRFCPQHLRKVRYKRKQSENDFVPHKK